MSATLPAGQGTPLPRVEIEYCTQCRWLLRAAWNYGRARKLDAFQRAKS